MLRNYLKIAYKVLMRRKLFTFISLFGISFTLVVLMVVAGLLDNTLSPLAPEVNLDRTLHVSYMAMRGDDYEWNGNPGYGFLDKYCRDIPGVEVTSFFTTGSRMMSFVHGEKIASRVRHTDAEYWKALQFDFVEGHPYDTQDEELGNAVAVLSEESRARFFGEGEAVGRTIELGGDRYEVVGVVKDVSRLRGSAFADIWVPITSAKNDSYKSQLMGDFSGVLVAESRDRFDDIRAEFASRLPHVEISSPDYDRMEGAPWTRFEEVVDGTIGRAKDTPRAHRFVVVMTVGALLFMLLPAINLVNINISRIYERMSEIGVRKAFGASTRDLVVQFVVENVFLCLVGGFLGLVLSRWVLLRIGESNLIPHAAFVMNYRLFLVALFLSMFFGVLSGVYPAWRMARLHPVDALRGGGR